MNKKIISALLIFTILLSVFMPLTSISASNYPITIYPETQLTSLNVGDTVSIVFNAGGDKLASFDGYLDYDTTIFEILSTDNENEEWEGIANKWSNDSCQYEDCEYGLFLINPANSGTSKYDANGELVKVTLTVKKATDSTTVKFHNIKVLPSGASEVITGTDTECVVGTKATPKCNITFDKNGGTFSGNIKQTDSIEQGTSYTIPSENLTSDAVTKPGYTFLGWSKSTTATTATYTNNNAIIPTSETTGSDLTLYAVWSANKGNLTIVPNGFSGYTADGASNGTRVSNKSYGLTATITKPTISPNTYQVKLNGNGGTINGTTYKNLVANVTFNNWIASGNAGSWNSSTGVFTFQPATNGATSTLTADFTVGQIDLATITPTRAGYTLLGWSKDASATTATYATNAKYTPSIGDNLYAVWKEKTLTVTFDKNTQDTTATLDTQNKTVTYNSQYETLATGTRKGHTLEGWYTESGCTNKVTNTTTVTNPDNHTLYAKWTKNNYDVKYANLTGATWKSGVALTAHDSSAEFDSTYQIISDVPQKTGYKFLGWNKNVSSSTTPDYVAGDTFKIEDSNITLYAVWETATYEITYIDDSGQASGMPQKQQKIHGTDITLSSSTPTRTGYNFKGWNTKADGKGTTYEKGVTYKTDSDLELHAQWEIKTYKITYSKTVGDSTISGMPNPLIVTKNYGQDLSITTSTPTRTGYTFDGWKDKYNTIYTTKDKITKNEDLTLYAIWTPKQYTVTFNLNATGNTLNPSSINPIQVTYDSTYGNGITWPTVTRTGYIFKGWNTKNDGTGSTITDTTTVKIIENQTLYAIWGPLSYTVTFDGNGGTPAQTTAEKVQDKTLELKPTTPTKEGYTFDGWNSDRDGNGTSYQMPYTYTENKDLTLYAQWATIKHVTFDGNGGTPEQTTVEKEKNKNLELNPTTPTKTGYIFAGWNSERDGNGKSYQMPYTYTEDKDITLYAQWTPITYIIRFDKNDDKATGTMNDQTVTYDQEFNLATNTYEKQGYEFAGWATSKSGAVTYNNNEQITNNLTNTQDEVINLYAKWNTKQYTITYHLNGGTSTVITEGQTDSLTYNIPQPTLSGLITKTGYENCKAWNTEPDGSGQHYDMGKTISITNDIDLYAEWKKLTFTIKFDANGGTGTIVDHTKEYDVDFTMIDASKVISKEGYIFTGEWNTEPDGSGDKYAYGDSAYNKYTKNENVTLYAQWKPITYIIKFNGNGNDKGTSMSDQTCKYGVEQNLNKNTFTKTGYVFDHWNTQINDSGDSYNDKNSILNLTTNDNDVITLYAQWKLIEYNITYNLNGGQNGPENQKINIENKPVVLNTTTHPNKTGYLFANWLGSNGQTYYGKENLLETYNDLADLELVAQWTPITYTIRFNGNGNDGGTSMATQIFAYDISDQLIKNTFTKTGYIFDHWNTAIDDSGESSYEDEAEILNLTTNNKETITLYAQWRKDSSIHKVEFYSDDTYTTLLYTDNNVADGTSANYNGTIPTKAEDAQYTYTFDHWEPLPNNVKNDMKVYAIFKENIKQYTVTFYDEDNTTILGTSTVNYGNNASYNGDTNTLTGTPKVGYTKTFKEWVDSSKLTNVTEDIRVVATYNEELIKYNIKYNNTYGVTNNNPTQYTVEDSDITLQNITRSGYTFNGWYTDSNFKNKVTTIKTEEAKDVILYAQWKVKESSDTTITENLYYVKVLFEDETTEENTFEYFNDARVYADLHVNENVRVFDSKGHIVYEPTIKVENLYLRSPIYKIGKTNAYVDGDVYISRIKPETTLKSFKNQCITNGDIEVYKTNGTKLNDEEYVGTNMILRVTKNNQTIVLTTAVIGDLDGNGKITVTDLSMLNSSIIGNTILNEASQIAGDIDDNDKISITDLSNINKAIIGKIIF